MSSDAFSRPKVFDLRVTNCVRNFFRRLIGMDTQTAQKLEEKKSDGFQNFSDRMTTGIAMASGGAAIGTFLGGPVGATVGALVSGVAGFLVSGSHDSILHKTNR